MVSNRDKRMYSEVCSIIDSMGEKYKRAIPQKIYQYIYDNREKDYQPVYDLSKPLKSQELSQRATSFVCFLHYKYWCENETEKAKISKILEYNQKKNKEKYNVDKIFEEKTVQKNSNENIEEQKQLVVYKENLFTKILHKLKNFFKRFH